MLTDMENAEREEFSGSSQTRRRGKSAKSQANSRTNSTNVRDGETGEKAETKLSSLDVLLSMLQSHLGEIRDFGGTVRFFDDPNGLIIQLPNVVICKSHKMMHFGQTCPMC